jgi:hypothetical protein
MSKTILILLTACLLSAGCVTFAARTPTPNVPAGSRSEMVIRSSSMNLLVEDPIASLSELERRVQEIGGYVNWSSSQSGNASLNARVPSERLSDIRLAARELGLDIMSDNAYNTDVSDEYQAVVERLDQLELAEDEIEGMLASAKDLERIASFQLALQLLSQEKKTVAYQVRDFEDRVRMGTVDFFLSSTAPTPFLGPFELPYQTPYGDFPYQTPYGDVPTPTPTPPALPFK